MKAFLTPLAFIIALAAEAVAEDFAVVGIDLVLPEFLFAGCESRGFCRCENGALALQSILAWR